ncbi:hypothetical protein X805_38060 [Sphaerotilus natans subsp. natans DSM 6575]|uniref:Uncharacterized protein n=1 Tax=Sphaerotilus natans subsp. natans DSM 6575 TaxID=1286631 RepID=A0A059KHN0_9BURK|nr:hypothetical protein [Sphaerotilus natans]KDB50598.1 hypothetical protein X805_38060 [Sphaerotilus natans subsp. natans DSM 6575]SIR52593.1 hypothetical protein SAMN05421778_111127 [Sphaerotilus natans]
MFSRLKKFIRSSSRPNRLQVGVLYPSGDVVVMWEGEAIPRVWPAGVAVAIADRVNAHRDLYEGAHVVSGALPAPQVS